MTEPTPGILADLARAGFVAVTVKGAALWQLGGRLFTLEHAVAHADALILADLDAAFREGRGYPEHVAATCPICTGAAVGNETAKAAAAMPKKAMAKGKRRVVQPGADLFGEG